MEGLKLSEEILKTTESILLSLKDYNEEEIDFLVGKREELVKEFLKGKNNIDNNQISENLKKVFKLQAEIEKEILNLVQKFSEEAIQVGKGKTALKEGYFNISEELRKKRFFSGRG